MADKPERNSDGDDDQPKQASLKAFAAAALLLVLFGVVVFGTVRGCATVDPQEQAKRDAEKKNAEEEKKLEQEKLDDPKIRNPVVLPNESPVVEQFVKPGHWVVAAQEMQARERDFIGRTRTEVIDDKKNQLPINNSPFLLESTRPAALAQGTTKFVESTFFVPQTSAKLWLATTFEEGALGNGTPRIARLEPMFPHQYHFLVLAKEPERYSLIKTLDSVQVPYQGEPGSQDTLMPSESKSLHYRVDLPDITRNLPVPDNALLWTSIAYVLWDEVDPDPLTPEQEDALVDWLHWGGQLIINGPDSLDLLQGSFLEPFLPATNGGPREIGAADLRTFNENWLIHAKTPGTPLAPITPWSGIKLVPALNAEPAIWESTGGLLAERRIGRGRIVVSAMQLSERDLVNWRSGFESFFNAAVLRRPPRVYHQLPYESTSLLWDPTNDSSLQSRRLDARLSTNLRYFSRDLGIETNYRWEEIIDESGPLGQMPGGGRYNYNPSQPAFANGNREYRPPPNTGGIGAWNDFNLTASAARNSLREAAGVDVPNRTFVVLCLAAYLIVLVPVNWLIFHMLGRVEWAWIAAPLIAIAGTFIVVHQAQLDIGFVRSQTEVGLLELQPGHPRGHLTRFTALYTSLSTTYEMEFDDSTALAMPFPRDAEDPSARGQRGTKVDFERQAESVRLAGLPVLSNSTNFVHSEQMFTLDGPIRIGKAQSTGGWQLENRSQLHLRSVGVIRKKGESLHGRWIGELMPGQTIVFTDPNTLPLIATGAQPFETELKADTQAANAERLNLQPLFGLAYAKEHLDDGELRLVARVDETISGQTISPTASQFRSGTLVIAHLDHAKLPALRRDKNTRLDMKLRIGEDED